MIEPNAVTHRGSKLHRKEVGHVGGNRGAGNTTRLSYGYSGFGVHLRRIEWDVCRFTGTC